MELVREVKNQFQSSRRFRQIPTKITMRIMNLTQRFNRAGVSARFQPPRRKNKVYPLQTVSIEPAFPPDSNVIKQGFIDKDEYRFNRAGVSARFQRFATCLRQSLTSCFNRAGVSARFQRSDAFTLHYKVEGQVSIEPAFPPDSNFLMKHLS